MKNILIKILFVIMGIFGAYCPISAQSSSLSGYTELPQPVKNIVPGADQILHYSPLLKNKRIALIVNQTSVLSDGITHLLDTLLKRKINIVKVFCPEHGFRGTADAGEKVANSIDAKTGISIISLYGNNKKPTKEQLSNVDVVVFDLQDVGARFYTYISTMHYTMQACAEYGKEFMVLDRPNPNGYYIAGPVLDLKYKSFVGMHPIPIVHGLTVGELAKMINGEKWLDSSKICKLIVIQVKNYNHSKRYNLPIKPSPNLPNAKSILLYPSLCLFEGTNISLGRGTDKPFQIIGAPDTALGSFTFVPKSIEGAAKNPPFEGKTCYGVDLSKSQQTFTIQFIIDFYNRSSDKSQFFNTFFVKLAGNSKIIEQIKAGDNAEKITQSWQVELNEYKQMRKKYLLYKDFE